ncbi:pyrroline-5-carboxylate reductase family protein, partial [Streptococcus suis]|uniref:pyrroline-5-carboxylate reductase family protein n=1 Tax=Streptococcus suis TaxID=1307 RepID=UPI00370C631F
MESITIIGGGNLGTAMAEGLIESGFIDPGKLTITRRNTTLLASLAAKGVNILSSNTDAVKQADCIILAVKP